MKHYSNLKFIVNFLDIALIKSYLKSAGCRFNSNDKIHCSGDMGVLTGKVEVYGGEGGDLKFTVRAVDNGTFVEWTYFDRHIIRQVNN
jgi:hypothetical protein